jgi:hypothetical protein
MIQVLRLDCTRAGLTVYLFDFYLAGCHCKYLFSEQFADIREG